MRHAGSRVLIGIVVALLGVVAVTVFYGSVAMGLLDEEPAAVSVTEPAMEAETEPTAESTAEPATEPVAISATEPVTEPATEPAAEPATEPATDEEFVELQEDDGVWNLALVSAESPLPEDYVPELRESEDGYLFDARAVGSLLAMLDGAREAGLSPAICSAYRAREKQLALYEAKVNEIVQQGYDRAYAEEFTKTIIAYPGTSEHSLGLSADIVASYYGTLDSTQADTPEAIWLAEHCQEYGFILRYPETKSDLTGIIFEPWHFRYVGKEAAKEIMAEGICLEEYLA